MSDTSSLQLVLAQVSPAVLLHAPAMVFVFCFGACVGSFINVVIYRLPAGMSVISPPSRCPVCGARLKFFRENLPILGWFLVRGRCLHCGVRVSPQYMIIESLMALVFLGLYIVLFMMNRGMPWWGQVGGPWWVSNMLFRAWPIYVTFAFLLAALVAMTVIDARTFTIPIQIPLFVTITAFIAYPLQSILPHRSPASQTWPIYGVNWPWFLTACGGMLGILIALVLLKSGRLRYSFADYDDYLKEDEPLAEYPHARREMRVELLFLLPCIIGLVAGFVVGSLLLPNSAPPEFIQAVGSTLLGYLVGGGLIWTIRILGTLAFDREAMGLGDVHLLAAIGAVLGWFDPVLIFFIAPFSGLVGAMLSKGLSAVFKLVKRQLPYGPHLAVATLVVLLCRPGIAALWQAYLSSPMPRRGLVQSVAPAQPAPRPGQPGPIPRLPTSSGSPPLTDGADKLTLQPVGGGSDVASRKTSERKRPCEGYGGAGA